MKHFPRKFDVRYALMALTHAKYFLMFGDHNEYTRNPNQDEMDAANIIGQLIADVANEN